MIRRSRLLARGGRLHVGCGPVLLPGWINIDNQRYRGIDHVHDVTRGLPFADLEFIFAEHFIEHLSQSAATRFLRDCRLALRPDGVLRLTTPSLDWVLATQYHWGTGADAVRDCFWVNKSFRGWGHQFLYNWPALTACLHDAGFAAVEPCRYGESRHEALRGIEHHERYPDTPELPHIIVVEASGSGTGGSGELAAVRKEFEEAVSVV